MVHELIYLFNIAPQTCYIKIIIARIPALISLFYLDLLFFGTNDYRLQDYLLDTLLLKILAKSLLFIKE